jgi:outer membrane protein, heavy metal efflux system
VRPARSLCSAGAGLVIALSFGCVRYVAKPVSPDATLDAYEGRRLDDPGLKRFLLDKAGMDRWPPSMWNLHDLTLVALYFNPRLDVARARWSAARAGVSTASARLNPALALSMGYNSTSVGISPWIPEALLSVPIQTAGKRRIRTAEALHLAETARLDVLSTAWQVRRSVREAFLAVSTARQRVALRAEESRLLDETVHMLTAQLDAGEISANEVTQARIALDAAHLAALEAQQQQAQARVRLADALGVPVTALADVDLSFAALDSVEAPIPTAEARRRALTSRTDVLAALSLYEAAQTDLRLEIAKQYPDVELGAGYQLDQTDNKWTLSVSLPLPILNRNKGPIAEADARRSEAAALFVALQANVLGRIDSALAACRAAEKRSTAANALVADLDRRAAAAEAANRVGETSRLELLGVERELTVSRQARLDAVAAVDEAEGSLEDAMQSPLDVREWVLETPRRVGADEGASHE